MKPSPPPRIVHVQGLAVGVVLYLDRMALEDEVQELLFPAARFPDGPPSGAVLEQWKGRFDQYHLVLSRDAWQQLSEGMRTLYLVPSPYTPAEVAAQRERLAQAAQEQERWLDTYHPIFGRTPREALKHPGWYVRKGHYVWVGHDPHDSHGSIQWVPLEAVDEVEERLRYYLNKGMSLADAMHHIEQSDFQALKAIALAMGGFDEIALAMIEEQGEREAAIAAEPAARELEADRLAVEAAIQEALKRMGRVPQAAQGKAG